MINDVELSPKRKNGLDFINFRSRMSSRNWPSWDCWWIYDARFPANADTSICCDFGPHRSSSELWIEISYLARLRTLFSCMNTYICFFFFDKRPRTGDLLDLFFSYHFTHSLSMVINISNRLPYFSLSLNVCSRKWCVKHNWKNKKMKLIQLHRASIETKKKPATDENVERRRESDSRFQRWSRLQPKRCGRGKKSRETFSVAQQLAKRKQLKLESSAKWTARYSRQIGTIT